jgi:hypothetical protein
MVPHLARLGTYQRFFKFHSSAQKYFCNKIDPKRKFCCPPRGIFSLGKGSILIACLGQTLGEL